MFNGDIRPFEHAKLNRRSASGFNYIYNLTFSGVPAMEAEKINAITRRLADVEGRTSELRRYL